MKTYLESSKDTLMDLANNQIKTLKNKNSMSQIETIHKKLKKYGQIAEIIAFIDSLTSSNIIDNANEQNIEDKGLITMAEFVAEGCHLLISLNNVKDENRIKEANLDWLTEETYNYIKEARQIFGDYIEVPPNIILHKGE